MTGNEGHCMWHSMERQMYEDKFNDDKDEFKRMMIKMKCGAR